MSPFDFYEICAENIQLRAKLAFLESGVGKKIDRSMQCAFAGAKGADALKKKRDAKIAATNDALRAETGRGG